VNYERPFGELKATSFAAVTTKTIPSARLKEGTLAYKGFITCLQQTNPKEIYFSL
jgi:hypothetical protein